MNKLDASILDYTQEYQQLRTGIRDKTTFKYTGMPIDIDLLLKCRVLTSMDDMQTKWEYTKAVAGNVNISVLIDSVEMCCLDGFNKAGESEYINEYPWIALWLIDDICSKLSEEVSDAWKSSKRSVPSVEPGDEEEGASGVDIASIVKAHFGDSLLFFCYEFMTECPGAGRPRSFLELFEFMRFMKTKSVVKSVLIESTSTRTE